MAEAVTTAPPAFGDQGRIRNWFHTRAGARFLNLQTGWFRLFSPRGYGVLTTVGRRTGARQRSAVRAIAAGERVVLVALGGERTAWLGNLRHQPQVSLRTGLRTRKGTARLPTDSERAGLRAAYCTTLTLFDFATSVVNQRGLPTPTRIRAMLGRWYDHGTALVIDFDTR